MKINWFSRKITWNLTFYQTIQQTFISKACLKTSSTNLPSFDFLLNRPQLDTSKFLGGEDYDYDSQPYLVSDPSATKISPTKTSLTKMSDGIKTSERSETSPLKEAQVKDFWGLDFRRKLATQQQIGQKQLCVTIIMVNPLKYR